MGYLVFGILALLLWLWWDGLGAGEIAYREAKRLCQSASVLLLDDSVALRRLRLCRDRQGQVGLYRRYHFEFSPDGEQRCTGFVDLLGRRILSSEMQPYRIDPPIH